MNKYELAWAAGFFDGEGHIRMDIINSRKRIQIRIAQATERIDILTRFCIAVGINPHIHIHTNNKIYEGRSRQSYISIDSFEKCQYVICMLWSYMCKHKRKQAVNAFNSYRDNKNNTVTKTKPKQDLSGLSLLDRLISKSSLHTDE